MKHAVPFWVAAAALFAFAACGTPPPAEDPPPPGATAHQGAAFEITEVRPGIWHAVGTGAMNVGANAAIVDLGESLLLVDSHITPAAAWVLLQELSPLTPKPVRYVVNTHFHFDHIHGNQVFGDDVEILGHEATYDVVAAGGSNSGTAWDAFVGTLPEQIATLESRLEAAAEADRAEIADALARTRAYQEATASITPFIGLFGTVVGIIIAFQEIGTTGSTNLAVVAPGIAEALIATAAGLFAAIPAVYFYNHLMHRVKVTASAIDDFSLEFLNIAERYFSG